MDISKIILAVISGLAVFILTRIIDYFSSRKGNRVILQFVKESPLISISAKYSKGLKITYNDRPIDDLILYEFSLYNDSNIDIGQISDFHINFYPEKPEDYFMDFRISESGGKIDLAPIEKKDDLGSSAYTSLGMTLPYLNSNKKLKEEKITLVVISNTRIAQVEVIGGGQGWRGTYKDSEIRSKLEKIRYIIPLMVLILFINIISFYLLIKEFVPGSVWLNENEKQMLILICAFGSLLSVYVLAIFQIGFIVRTIKRVLSKRSPIDVFAK